jgi:hypothetical protein
VLRIDPAAPPLWRTPDSLQFGHDPALALLEDVPPGMEHVIHALALGTDRRTLDRTAAQAGIQDVDALLQRLDPVLIDGGPEPRPLTVAVHGAEDLAAFLRPWLVPPGEDGADVVVLVAHHLVAPADTVRWLAEDVPHLPLVFDDQAALIGPFVVPGRTPCLRCAEEHRLQDPARRAIAAQLLRRGPARTTRSIRVRLGACAALGDALDALRETGTTGLEAAALRVAADGTISRERRPWHDRCWCRRPDAAAPKDPAPRGTATDAAPPAAVPATAPTTAAGGPWPA